MVGVRLNLPIPPEFASIAPKLALAVGAAAIVASSMTVFAGARDLARPATFAERFVVPVAAAECSLQNWPYIDNRCLQRQDGAPVRPVRVIAVDRVIRN
jgi:hypothetical protein